MKRPDQCEIDPAEPVMVLHRRGNTDSPHPVGTGEHAERDRKEMCIRDRYIHVSGLSLPSAVRQYPNESAVAGVKIQYENQ